MADDLETLYPGRAGADGQPRASWLDAMANLYRATVAENDAVRNSQSAGLMLRDVYQRRVDAIKAATGAALDNPMDAVPERYRLFPGAFPQLVTPDMAARRWADATTTLAAKFPDARETILGGPSVQDEANDLGRQRLRQLDTAAASPALGAIGRFAATLAGGLTGMVRDPLQAPMLAVGGGLFGVGKSALGMMARGTASEAVTNAAMEAAVQPIEQGRRKDLGAEYGVAPAIAAVEQAGLIGGLFGAASAGVGVALHGAKSVKPSEVQAAQAKQAAASVEADAAAWGPPPPGLTPDEQAMLKAQSIGATETPAIAARPSGPVSKPMRAPDVARIVDERTAGETAPVAGKPVAFATFDPKDIGTDARTFQYKDGGDAAGVTDRLAGVTRWDPMASGKVFVFETADGAKVIADGHQRLGLAKRLQMAGQDVKLDGYLFRAADGWTPADVRALAAKKNLQEGSGSAMDAARILRDRPDVLDASLPTTGPMLRKAQGLARLSDDAWRMVTNGLVPDAHGALVGEMEANPARHAAILADLKRYAPETEREARLLVQEIQASGVQHEQQTDMFGTFDVAKSLIGERVKVLDGAMQQLRNDKRVFGELQRNADVIEQAGNQLDRSGNRVRAVSADFLATLIEKMARSKGEMSDLLTEAARGVVDGGAVAAQSRHFLADVKGLIERRGFAKLMHDADAPPPVLKPEVAPEPGTSAAVKMAEAAAPIDRLKADALLPSPDEFFANLPNRSMDEIYAVAQKHQDALIEVSRKLAQKYGVEFKEAKIKARATAEEKMVRKGYDSTAQLTDIVRGGFVVDTPAKADDVVRALGERYQVFDEGWKRTREGYVDRKALVRFDDGTIGEVQFWEPNMLAAKNAEGHRLYEEWRVSTDESKRKELSGKMNALYSAAEAKAGPDWGSVDRSSGPNLGSNFARQSASDMTPAVWKTSAASTLDHALPGDRTANASKQDGSTSTAGRRSQSQNVNDMGNTSTGDIGTQTQNSNLSSADGQKSLWDVMPESAAPDAPHVTAADMLADADRTQHLSQVSELCTQA